MEYCTSIYCFGHKQMYACKHKQWWGSCTAYTVSKEELRNIFWCYLRENLLICNACKKWETCERLDVLRERCNSAYLYKKWKDAPYQPIWYKVFFFDLASNVNFRLEVAAVKKC